MTRSHSFRAALVVLLLASTQAFAQGPAPHWVATWTNAVVALPVAPAAPPAAAPAAGAAPAATPATGATVAIGAAAPAGGQPPAGGRGGQGGGAQAGRGGGGGGRGRFSLNDQTLRQNVHISIGGDRLRVVLTNPGTSPSRRCRIREHRGERRARAREKAMFFRPTVGHDSTTRRDERPVEFKLPRPPIWPSTFICRATSPAAPRR